MVKEIKIDPATAFGDPEIIKKIHEQAEEQAWIKKSVKCVRCWGEGKEPYRPNTICHACDGCGRIAKNDDVLK